MHKRWLIIIALLMLLAQGVNGIKYTVSGGGSDSGGTISTSLEIAKEAAANSEIAINGADLRPSTKVKGKVKAFEQTHTAKDKSGKTASTYVKVVNAPSDMYYSSAILPRGVNAKKIAPWVSAEQSLSVPKADSIITKASASYAGMSADVGLEMHKGSLPGDFVTLSNYYGKAYASDGSYNAYPYGVGAIQTADSGSADSIRIYNHANDGSGLLSIDTYLNGKSGVPASFSNLDTLSQAGTDTKVTQKVHVTGDFTSTASSEMSSKSRTSNDIVSSPAFTTDHYLDMQAVKGSLPIGKIGYYLAPGSTIQAGVDAVGSGDEINLAATTYYENVNIPKSLTIIGAGAGNTIVNGDANRDGVGDGSVFTIGYDTNRNLDVILSGMTLTGGTGISTPDPWGGMKLGGGGVFNYGTTTLIDCVVSGNTAFFGGGIFNKGGILNLNGGSITGNTASHGGGISTFSGTVNVNHGSISENTAGSHGGGIYNLYGTVNMDGGSITGNTASQYGGGIGNEGTLNLNGGSITGNTASQYGGGIYNNHWSIVNMDGGSITGNTANYGGGIYNDDGELLPGGNYAYLNLNGGSITDNIASQYGGGIYSTGSHITFDGTQVVVNSNKAHLPSPSELSWYQGWGVYLTTGTPTTTGGFDSTKQVVDNHHI